MTNAIQPDGPLSGEVKRGGEGFDTSGYVTIIRGANNVATQYPWRALDAFTQEYTEAVCRAAEDTLGGYTATGVRYSDLAPETLARIIADCAAAPHSQAAILVQPHVAAELGRQFWTTRQSGEYLAFPPLTVTLGDAGKVYLAGVRT